MYMYVASFVLKINVDIVLKETSNSSRSSSSRVNHPGEAVVGGGVIADAGDLVGESGAEAEAVAVAVAVAAAAAAAAAAWQLEAAAGK
jgi:hypothetical protein